MRIRSRAVALAALASVAALVLASCGGGTGGGDGGVVGSDQLQAGVNDINPIARDAGARRRGPALAAGRDPADNFNYHQFDGTLRDNADVIDALMPAAFPADADASVTVEPGLLHLASS